MKKETKNKSLKSILEEFEREFCNNHQKPIRFLRSIFYDEQDGAEKIEEFIKSSLTYLLSGIIEEIEKKRLGCKETILYKTPNCGSCSGCSYDSGIREAQEIIKKRMVWH